MPFYISPPPSNPLIRLLMVLIGAVVLVGSFMLGLVVLAVVAGLGLIAAAVLWLRVAWIRYRLRQRKAAGSGAADDKGGKPGEFLEGEYTVVRRRGDSDRGDL